MIEVFNKVLDFLLSDTGQIIILAVVSLVGGSEYGKRMKVTEKQVQKVLETAKDFKDPGKEVDTKGLTKEVQRQIRKSLGGLIN